MCPVCIATAALIAASATSTGGLSAIVAKKFRSQAHAEVLPAQPEPKENNHDN
jgi:hypothetical protein